MHIVLSISELLEQIFLHTDTTTLLTSTQRVCRLWNTIITQTPSLQRHLFFLPRQCPGHTGTQQDDHSPTVLTLNPHLRTIYPSWFPNPSALTDGRGCRTSNLEPELLRVFEMDGDHPFERENASWRRMLLMQPPTLGVGFVSVQSLHERATVKAWRVTQDGKRWEWTVNRNAHGTEIGEAVELEIDQGQGGEGREMRELEPITIGSFYDLVVRNSGNARTWFVVWDNGLSSWYNTLGLWGWRQLVKGLVKACGVAVVELSTDRHAREERVWYPFDIER